MQFQSSKLNRKCTWSRAIFIYKRNDKSTPDARDRQAIGDNNSMTFVMIMGAIKNIYGSNNKAKPI